MTRQMTFDDDSEDTENDDPRSGEFFRKETLRQWRGERWRKPDVFETYAGGAHAIWYGPAGVDGDTATECVWDDNANTFEVSEYQSVAGLFDSYDKSAPFLKNTTRFTLKAVHKAVKDIGQKPTGILMWAVGLGVAQLAYFGGAEDMVCCLPVSGDGLSGDVVHASRRFIDSSIPRDVEVLKDGSWLLADAYVRIVEGSDRMWRVRDKRDRLWTSGLHREWNTPRAAYNAYRGLT
jgi:hypothetical protein